MAPFIFIEKDHFEIPPDTKVIKASTYRTYHKAEKTLQKVRSKAEEILTAAQNVYIAEKKRGYEEGRQEANQELAAKMTETAAKTAKYFSGLEKDVVTLVMDVVRKVIADMNEEDRIAGQVKNALSVIKSQKSVILRVAPSNSAILNKKISQLLLDYPSIDIIDVKADPRLSPTDLILETETGIVDAAIAFQLSTIEEAFKKCFKDA